MTNKRVFSADDWGFSPGINEGILELARNNLLSSVSCAANTRYLKDGLSELLTYAENGLRFNIHFNLTYGLPCSSSECSSLINGKGEFHSLNSAFLKTMTGKMLSSDIAKEFVAQMAVLRDCGIPIEGLDGHHHVHLLPLIYKSIKHELHNQGIHFVRLMADPDHRASYVLSLFFKTFIFENISDLQLMSCGYLMPSDLTSENKMRSKLNQFSTVLVHPAKYNDFTQSKMMDPLQEQRVKELDAIMELFCAKS